jgi:hypothetical protein
MRHSRAAVAALALMGGLLGAELVGAEPDSFHFQVMTVRATGVGPCDARLAALRPRLRRVSGYRGFELVDDVSQRIAMRTHTVIRLPEGRVLRVLPKSILQDVLHLQVRLLDGRRRVVDTNLRLPTGGTLVFGLGPNVDAGEEATLFVLRASGIR